MREKERERKRKREREKKIREKSGERMRGSQDLKEEMRERNKRLKLAIAS